MHQEIELKEIFVSVLGIELDEVNDELQYQQNAQWDSINHMYLVTELENSFEIELDSEEIFTIKHLSDGEECFGKIWFVV